MTNVLEMMKRNVNSVIGKTLSLDLGGSKPLVGVVVDAKQDEWYSEIDGELYSYSVSFGGCGYYPVDCLTKVLD